MNLSKTLCFSNSLQKNEVLRVFVLINFLFLMSCHSKRSKFEAKSFQSKHTAMNLPYQILLAQNYKKNKKYPLIIHLHGYDKRGNDNQKPLERVENYFYQAQEHKDCIVIIPQCPKNLTWESAKVRQTTFELIQEIEKNYSIDTQKIYITGLSMGGFGVWSFLESYPQKFAAAIAICGGGNPESVPKFKNTVLWIFHGAKDESVSVENSRKMFNALKKAGAKPKYREYPELAHNSWDAAFQEKELWQWIFEQKRK